MLYIKLVLIKKIVNMISEWFPVSGLKNKDLRIGKKLRKITHNFIQKRGCTTI